MLIVLYLHHLHLSFGLKSFYFQEFLEKLVIVISCAQRLPSVSTAVCYFKLLCFTRYSAVSSVWCFRQISKIEFLCHNSLFK